MTYVFMSSQGHVIFSTRKHGFFTTFVPTSSFLLDFGTVGSDLSLGVADETLIFTLPVATEAGLLSLIAL